VNVQINYFLKLLYTFLTHKITNKIYIIMVCTIYYHTYIFPTVIYLHYNVLYICMYVSAACMSIYIIVIGFRWTIPFQHDHHFLDVLLHLCSIGSMTAPLRHLIVFAFYLVFYSFLFFHPAIIYS